MIKRATLLATAAALLMGSAAPAFAQDGAGNDARRLDRLERELRAVQRRVFPGSEGGLVQPEVTPGTASAIAPSAATPVADLNGRIDAIEAQLARLTGEVEQQAFRQRGMDAAIAQLRTDLNARTIAPTAAPDGAAEGDAGNPAPVTTVRPAPAPGESTPPGAPSSATPTRAANTPAATTAPATASSAATPTPRPAAATAPAPSPAANAARRAQVAAIEVPSTGDAPEDAYIYGYRLWDARLYPEAQAQLQKFVADHPTHRRASFAGNLLGRAYLDNNQPTLAVRAFYDNYRTRPAGERAGESVYFMGMALIRLDRAPDACRTFDEFDRGYGATASNALKAQVAAARGQARC